MGKIMDIIIEECEKGEVPVATILSDTRTLKVCNVRHLAMWRARTELNESYLKIARIFKRDHTSVINGVNRVAELGYDVVASQYAKSRRAKKDKRKQIQKIRLESIRKRNMEIIYEHRNDV